jgi:mannose-6-phosphate isomerase-like protein (cupin superfamily)
MSETSDARDTWIRKSAGVGHNSDTGGEVSAVERWTKKRVFVRALEGTYGDLVKDLFTQPRVYSTRDMKWKGGPSMYDKFPVNPQHARITQAIETHIDVLAPGAYGQKHGHMNSAVFYVLKGRGYDIHDGRRIDWEAGDALIVENACVHQHLNADPDNDAIVMVAKAKPLFLFMHMMFQKVVTYPPKEPMPGHEDYQPPADF